MRDRRVDSWLLLMVESPDRFIKSKNRALIANMSIKYDRLILIMDDTELEQFCRQWVDGRLGYTEVRRFAATGDKGRDVVGFLTKQRHEGPWDNYQCKQYRKPLSVTEGLLAVGKVLYWASRGEFTAPRKFYFVAPKGLNQKLAALIDKPSEFKQTLLLKWEESCGKKIIKDKSLPLDQALIDAVHNYSFHEIHKITIDELMDDPGTVPLLVNRYGADPGHYPAGAVPAVVGQDELKYLRAMVDAYSERENISFANHEAVFAHATHGPDLRVQRVCYFEADAFQKFYRDNTSPKIIETFRRDIYLGIRDKLKAPTIDALERVEAVMSQAAVVSPAGPLAKYAYVPVKQGVCHHLVNDDEISWKAP
jgi:hypothetical protein